MIEINKVENLNKLLALLPNESLGLGLASGKMGLSIYFHHLSRKFADNKEHKKLARKYLNDVFENIATVNDVDIKSGLAGVGLGINHLAKNGFIKGNINHALSEVDDLLFKTLSTPKYIEQANALMLTQLLYYFCIRLQDQKQGSENEILFKEICIKTINSVYAKMEKTHFGSRLVYNTEQELPLFLYALSKANGLGFYNTRIANIFQELSPVILSTLPVLHCNRLYLLWALSVVCKQNNVKIWTEHIELLKRELDLDKIVDIELRDRNIFFGDGAVSVFLLAEGVKKQLGEEVASAFQQRLIKKIEQSEVWKLSETDSQYFNAQRGLYNGFCGAALLLATYKEDKI